MNHPASMVDDFELALKLGKRALFLLSSFPFFVVGKVKAVGFDFVVIKVEFGVPIQLKNKPLRVQLENIHAFFAEDGKHVIPDFTPDHLCSKDDF